MFYLRSSAFIGSLVLALTLFGAATAQDVVPVPPPKAHVTDLTGALTAEQAASLEDSLAEFERRKGSQMAVLLVSTTKPETIEQFGIRVAERWKIGRRGIDDGAILIVATQDRTLRIEVGYGLEGVIPDVTAKRVIEEVIVPRFRTGDLYGGIHAGTTQLMRLVEGESLPPPRSRPASDRQGDWSSLLMVLFVIAIAVGGTLTALLGRFIGSLATGGVAGAIALFIVGSAIGALVAGVLVFICTLILGAARHAIPGGPSGWGRGPWAGGGGWSSGGGWSGGGGGFGGGGASGRW